MYYELPCFCCGEIMLLEKGDKFKLYVDSKGKSHPYHDTCAVNVDEAIERHKRMSLAELAKEASLWKPLS